MANDTRSIPLRIAALTVLALVAFAANSVLGRMALGPGTIDPASYATIRLGSGALALWFIVTFVPGQNGSGARGDWMSAAMLFLYAITFSFAYLSVDTGVGALILFGAVQATMILAGVCGGERPHLLQWLGLVIALGGLAYLVSPGMTAPSPVGAALMAIAGIGWGVYSLRGRGPGDPIPITAGNFIRTVPLSVAVSFAMLADMHVSPTGTALAILSGAVSSGMGYAIWYTVLPSLSAMRAATVQLSAPVLATVAGVILMSEPITLRLVLSTILILGGVGLTVAVKERLHRHS